MTPAWLIPKGMEWDDESDSFKWPDDQAEAETQC
jgi:hypothetical protein